MSAQHAQRWSIGFGVWWGAPVRLHLLLLLFAVLAVGVTVDGSLSTGLLTAGVLIASVVLHEAAHCLAAIRLGGQVDAVVLSPIGGLQSPRVPDEPEPQIFVALIGPLANLLVVITALAALVLLESPAPRLLPLLNPVAPYGMLEGSLGVVALKQALWINWTLFLLNLLPTYPFDGGPALRAMLWPIVGRRTAAVATAYTGQAAAAVLCAVALFVEKTNPDAVMPLWAPLVVLAVFLFFSAQRDLALAHNLDATADSLRSRPRPAESENLIEAGWLDADDEMVLVEHNTELKIEQRRKKREADEAYEDARVDDILARLHSAGFEQLSEEDRAILQRASRRYRDRRQDEQ